MASFLKKVARGVKRIVKNPIVKKAAIALLTKKGQQIASTPTGQKAQAVLKNLGQKVKPLGIPIPVPKPVQVAVETTTRAMQGKSTNDRIALPGGKSIKTAVRAAPRRKKAAASARKAPRATKSGRKAPSGGLDLKALSASWKKAGKPGKWIDWVKTHR